VRMNYMVNINRFYGLYQPIKLFHIKSLVEEYRKQGYPIIHVIRLYHSDGSNIDLCRKQSIENGNGKLIVTPGTNGADVVDELKPSSDTKLDSDLLLSGQLSTYWT
jgi:hypothetical protein